MPKPAQAQALYPKGPKASLGKDLLGGGGYEFHLGKLINGTEDEREAFVERYGYEDALDRINQALKQVGRGKDPTGWDTTPWHDDMLEFRDKLLARQGS